LRLAVRSLWRQRGRTALTSLGILIGIAAVVVVVALGQGARQRVASQLSSLGSNLLYVFPQSTAKSGARGGFAGVTGLEVEDAEAIAREASAVAAVTVFASTSVAVSSSFANETLEVVGADQQYLEVRGYTLAAGENFSEEDLETNAKVVLIGATVHEKLFGQNDPVGHRLRIGQHTYRVIGSLQSKGQSPFGADQDARILMPIGSWFTRVSPGPSRNLQIIMCSAVDASLIDQAERQITDILRQRHRISDPSRDDFQVRTQRQFQQTQDNITGVLSLLLLSVAGISLFVGGVGVMNILLVSVNERKREIGLRLAVGARPSDIRLQFLAEALVLTLNGGIWGLLLAGAVVLLMQDAFAGILAFDWTSVGIAVGVSLALGLAFGFWPAHRASRLDPIEALHHE
jgi:putative ABC transport system permease protein